MGSEIGPLQKRTYCMDNAAYKADRLFREALARGAEALGQEFPALPTLFSVPARRRPIFPR